MMQKCSHFFSWLVLSTYHQRQLGPSVKAPPSKGPITLAVPYDVPINPVYAGALLGGAMNAMIV